MNKTVCIFNGTGHKDIEKEFEYINRAIDYGLKIKENKKLRNDVPLNQIKYIGVENNKEFVVIYSNKKYINTITHKKYRSSDR